MFLILQNDAKCPPGNCSKLLDAAGEKFATIACYCDEAIPDLNGLTGVIVLGGVMGVHDTEQYPHLLRVRAFMERAVAAEKPILGICLGGQLLAEATGGEVTAGSPYAEKGVCHVVLNEDGDSDPLFVGVPRCFATFQFHNDSFAVPPAAKHLAASGACAAQAFRVGKVAYAVQFHPEVDEKIVSEWGKLTMPVTDFLPSFHEDQESLSVASHAIIRNFIAIAKAAPAS